MTERLLTREEVANLLQIPPSTLAQWACRGEGPAFHRVGRWARYRTSDVERWLVGRRRDPEKQESPVTVRPPRKVRLLKDNSHEQHTG